MGPRRSLSRAKSTEPAGLSKAQLPSCTAKPFWLKRRKIERQRRRSVLASKRTGMLLALPRMNIPSSFDRETLQQFLANAFAVQESRINTQSLSDIMQVQRAVASGKLTLDGAMRSASLA